MDLMIWIYFFCLVPFVLMGFWWLFKYKLDPLFKSRKGYIKVIRMLSNGQIRSFWAMPVYETAAEEYDEDGNKIGSQSGYFFEDNHERMQFIDHPSTVMYDGNVRMAVYDPDGNQMNISAAQKLVPAVAPAMLNSLAERTWSAGRAAAEKGAKQSIILQLFIAFGIVIIISMLYYIYTNQFDMVVEHIKAAGKACSK